MRVTHIIATLEVSTAVYAEIEALLRAADYGHAIRDGLIDMTGIGLAVSPTSPRARADYVCELNYARAFNVALEAAENVVRGPEGHEGERSCEDVANEIYALRVPYRRPEVEALFTRRDELSDKGKENLSAAERKEYESLKELIMDLPTGRTPEDQGAMDFIHRAKNLLKRHEA